MSSGPCDPATTSKATSAEQSLCLTTQLAAPIKRDAGDVSGALRPRSRDLSAELPALFEALAARPGVVSRMANNLTERETVTREAGSA